MPYDISHTKDGYIVKKKGTNEIVARPKDEKGLKGFLYHATKGEDHMSFKDYLTEKKEEVQDKAVYHVINLRTGQSWEGPGKNAKEAYSHIKIKKGDTTKLSYGRQISVKEW